MYSSGIPKALGAIGRQPKQNTEGLLPDDGFVRITNICHGSYPNLTDLIERIKHNASDYV